MGLTPDVYVIMTEEDYNNDRDPQLEAAIETLLAMLSGTPIPTSMPTITRSLIIWTEKHMIFDPTYLCYMAPAFLLMALTSWYVKAAYNKWSQVRNQSGLDRRAGCPTPDIHCGLHHREGRACVMCASWASAAT